MGHVSLTCSIVWQQKKNIVITTLLGNNVYVHREKKLERLLTFHADLSNFPVKVVKTRMRCTQTTWKRRAKRKIGGEN